MRRSTMIKKYNKLIVLLALILLSIVFRDNYYILLLFCTIGIATMVVSGLDILFGYSGQISLGHAAFYAIGAYTSAILSTTYGVPVWISMFCGAILATGLAILIAIPSVKLVHHFLALVTISFGQLVYLFVANAEGLTSGYSGINFIPKPNFFGFELTSMLSYFYFILVVVTILLILKQNIVESRTGRSLIAIRENSSAANGTGINVRKYKVMAFALSAFYTGLAGAIYAHLIGFISPESFMQEQSTIFLTMLLFGGMGNFWGPITGAIVLTAISESLQKLGSYQMLVYGVFLLIVIVWLPGGISGGLNPIKVFLNNYRKKGENKDA